MYVCLCHAVKEAEITAAVARGCNDLEAMGKALGVGTRCGVCRCEIQSIIDCALGSSLKNVNVLEVGTKDNAAQIPV